MPDTSREWDGGYIYTDKRKRDVYVIRKQMDGHRYEVSTRCHTSSGAHEQLKRFEANPADYQSAGNGAPLDALTFDKTLIEAFLLWSRDSKGNTKKWVVDQKRALKWWAGKLGRIDLRHLTAARLVASLDGAPGRKQRIATIKTLYGWLVKERHALDASKDPTLGIMVPQSNPEQWQRVKVIPRADYLKASKHLSEVWRDGIMVLAGTGWHVSELVRFVKAGVVEKHPRAKGSVIVCPRTKGGAVLKTSVSPKVAQAAARLRERGTFSDRRFYDALSDASDAAKVDTITPGRFRHSVATWAINEGADPAAVAAFLGHRSQQTTRKFYATHAVPAKVPTLA